MDVTRLNTEEVRVELEIRGLNPNNAPVTEELITQLAARLEDEKKNPLQIPDQLHAAARKNPKREAAYCSKKLSELQQHVLGLDPDSDANQEAVNTICARSWHLHKRIGRLVGRPVLKEIIPELFKASRKLMTAINQVARAEKSLDDSVDQVMDIHIPEVEDSETADPEANTEPMGREVERPPPKLATPPAPPLGYPEYQQPTTSTGFPLHDLRQEVVESLGEMKLEIDRRLNDLYIGDAAGAWNYTSTSTKSHTPAQRSQPQDEKTIYTTTLPEDVKGCRDPSKWGIKFEGTRSTLHVERFFYRVERMAMRAKIPPNSLVECLSVCLTGEALDWYWVHLERHPAITWQHLKEEMTQRFQSNRSDEDIRRLLDQRKQMYPKESFNEFHDAIVRLALQAQRPMTDHEIYKLLRRNMRPGLQLELHNDWSFTTIPQLIRQCVSLEDLWNRFGYNPEAGLSTPRLSAAHPYGDRNLPRVNAAAGGGYLRKVYELTDPGEFGEEANRSGGNNEPPAEWPQAEVCAINNHVRQTPADRGNRNPEERIQHHAPVTVMKRKTDERPNTYSDNKVQCWNCGSRGHLFMDCRVPVRHVFCFGCGLKDTYRPDCQRCSTRSGNQSHEMRYRREPYFVQSDTIPNHRPSQEDAASNTDPKQN